MIFQHHRFQIWNINQHPYKHSLSEMPYSNPALPAGEVQNAKQAMDWLLAVLYPNQQSPVATPAALPLVGNTLNDYRVVNDDGDGKAASYRWEQREGDVAPQWYKIYDMDWGEQSVLSQFINKTQDIYVVKHGNDDLDASGTPVAGTLAGQSVYGGVTAGTNLSLFANSGDGVGADTGFVQFGDDVRPITDSDLSLGTTTNRWLNLWSDEANLATFNISTNQITSSIGTIDFDDENLLTSGTATAGTLTIEAGAITDTSGTIDFDNEDLTTTGSIFGGRLVIDTIEIDADAITASGDLTINATEIFLEAPTNITGLLSVTGGVECEYVQVDSNGIRLDNATISNPGGAGPITIDPDNSVLVINGEIQVGGDVIGVTGQFTGDMEVDGTVFVGVAQNTELYDGGLNTNSGGFTINPFNGVLSVEADIHPNADNTRDLGSGALRYADLFLAGNIGDGSTTISSATIQSLRDINAGVVTGDTIFWDGTQWVASAPDTEIDHGTIDGLLDDDHTQYALLAGRAGGQVLIGGTGSGDDLTLRSTSHATKGSIFVDSDVVPFTDLLYHLGSATNRFDDVYTAGEFFGLRFQNVTSGTLPVASGLNVGRAVWATDVSNLYVDTGGAWLKLTTDKHVEDDAVTWDGTNVTQTYTVSASVDDARNCVWQFLDNTNGFRNVDGAVITKTSTQVTVTFTIPPAAGTYRLVGVG